MHIDESLPRPLTGIHRFLLVILTQVLFGTFFFLLPFPYGTWERVFLDGKLIATPLEFRRVAPRLEGAVLSAVERIRKGRLSVAEENSSPRRLGTDSLLASV